MKQPDIRLTEMDYMRLQLLLDQRSYYTRSDQSELDLKSEIDRASLLDFTEVPPNLITMNTHFDYWNMTDNKVSDMKIVYPQFSDPRSGCISVTAPLGAAFIGLSIGDEIDWVFPDKKVKRLKVLSIHYQPEAHGDLHL